jgi:N-acetylglucosamine-6-sulfatase
MIDRIETALRDDGVANNTYLVFSSDNGLHTGEYRLMPGKLTAFDTDIHVPLIVTGPGVPAGTTNNDIVQNIDLAKTFAAIGGTTMQADGTSLLPLLDSAYVPTWRNAALIEHLGRKTRPGDPDYQGPSSANPPSYEAMRTRRYLYVEYKDGDHEFYDLLDDPYELDNVYNLLSPQDKALLHSELMAMENCHTGLTCWAAMHVSNSNPPY